MAKFKPAYHNSVSPYFMVDGAAKLIELLVVLFDVKILRRYHKPDGKIMHIEVQIDDSVIMMSDSTPQYSATHYWMHVYVADVDATFRKAVEFGGEMVDMPNTKDNDPDRRGTFKDFAGNIWSVATQIQ